jgi:hypothetical protein
MLRVKAASVTGTNGAAPRQSPPKVAKPAKQDVRTTPATDLLTLGREALLDLWQSCFGNLAPKGMSVIFLRRFLAFELQARALGGLPAPLLAKLARIDAGQDRPPTPTLKPGGRLLREWNGVTHVVDVTPGGYLWQGKHHRSLSVIARAITGAHWSGPRFFGVKPSDEAKGKAHDAPRARAKSGAAQ